MNIIRLIKTAVLAGAVALAPLAVGAEAKQQKKQEKPKQFKYSTTIEKERPELDEETKRLIAAYRKNPSEANRAALKRQVEKNYDAVLARKKAKLEELKKNAKHQSKIDEMQVIVDEMIRDRDNRVEQSMKRFADPRLRPGSRGVAKEYLPLIGAAENVNIAYTPVTNADYAKYLEESGAAAPAGWVNCNLPTGKEKHPVVNVSYNDAVAYCKWLTRKDGKAVYRLPTEKEWEFAAGHMPKDADFNCGEHNSTTAVDVYKKTLAACGAIDMWGNCWEWTSTKIKATSGPEKGRETMEVKGGAFDSPRTSCRTESRGEGRLAGKGYANVTFRVVCVK